MTTAIKQVWVKFLIKEGCIGTLSLIFASALFSCGNSPMSQVNLGLNVASIGAMNIFGKFEFFCQLF
jgi:hypothetical protein